MTVQLNSNELPKIGAPATRALLGAGYKNLDEVSKASESELKALHGFGPKALRILKEELQKQGKSFNGKDKADPKDIKFVEDHIANAPLEVQKKLQELRAIIQSASPDSVDAVSYSMPAFRYKGIAIICYSAWKNHIGFYPMSGAVTERYKKELEELNLSESKGAIQLPFDKPLPTSLIVSIVKDKMIAIDQGKKR
jgi:uncharacterized protein YdhG (YjbR/CyaY superfamily)